MDQNDALRLLIEDAVRRVTEPMQRELAALRAELEALKNGGGAPTPSAGTVATPAPEAASWDAKLAENAESPDLEPSEGNLPVNAAVPSERTDFMRFLQRGLEQEEKDYAPKEDAAPEKKRGWNPFKR